MCVVLCPQQPELISKWLSQKPSCLYAQSRFPIRRIDCKVLSITRRFSSLSLTTSFWVIFPSGHRGLQWELPYQPLLLQTPQFNSSGCGLCGRRTNSPRTFVPEFSRRRWSKCDGLLSKSFLWNWKVFPGYGQSDKQK